MQEEDHNGAVSRRLALTVLVGAAAAVGSKVAPADAAYGESGNYLFCCITLFVLIASRLH